MHWYQPTSIDFPFPLATRMPKKEGKRAGEKKKGDFPLATDCAAHPARRTTSGRGPSGSPPHLPRSSIRRSTDYEQLEIVLAQATWCRAW